MILFTDSSMCSVSENIFPGNDPLLPSPAKCSTDTFPVALDALSRDRQCGGAPPSPTRGQIVTDSFESGAGTMLLNLLFPH